MKIALHTAQHLPLDQAAPFRQQAVSQIDRVVQQVRGLSLSLRPPMIDDLGLVAALRWHAQGVTEATGLPVRLEAAELPGRLPAEVEMACFRVVQEALHNAVKYAQARQLVVELSQQGTELLLAVRDNGIGFDVSAARRCADPGRNPRPAGHGGARPAAGRTLWHPVRTGSNRGLGTLSAGDRADCCRDYYVGQAFEPDFPGLSG